MSESSSSWKGIGCLTLIVLALIGMCHDRCSNQNRFSCEVCGEYTFEEYADASVFSDSDIGDMIGSNRVEDYKEKLASEPAAIYVIQLQSPEVLDDGNVRGEVYIGVTQKYYGNEMFKGKFVTINDEPDVDGMIRIEHKYNDYRGDWEQITFGERRNIFYFYQSQAGMTLEDVSVDISSLVSLDGASLARE